LNLKIRPPGGEGEFMSAVKGRAFVANVPPGKPALIRFANEDGKVRHRSQRLRAAFVFIGWLIGSGLIASTAALAEQTAPDLILLFTHDLHSSIPSHRALDGQGRIEPRGGFARIAAMIKAEREKFGERVLAVDAGDMIIGSFFQTLFQSEAPEFRLLGLAGFEAATLGNHEFDFGPSGLARALAAAKAKGSRLPLIASNTVFDSADGRDDTLEAAWKDYPVRDFLILEKNGLRIGIFGLVGRDAADDAPDAVPVTFADPLVRAREITTILREREKIDLVIALSHSGTSSDRKNSADEKLARTVPEIDVIISGHTHTRLAAPIHVGSTLIVSAGERGEDLGVLGLVRVPGGRFQAASYELRPVTADIPEDPLIAAEISALQTVLDKEAGASTGLRSDEVVAETAFALTPQSSGPDNEGREVGLGDLIVDGFRRAVRLAEKNRPHDPLLVIFPWGHIRDSLLPGLITVDDVFRVLSLGIGPDGRPGYPLVSVWLTGREIRRLFEVETTIAPGKEDAHLQIAGVSFRFNPRRVPFDRVTRIEVEYPDGTIRPLESERLYRIVSNLYMARMIAYVSRASHGILKLEPKDASGRLRTDFENLIIDADPVAPAGQEIKEWVALAEFLRSFPDTNGNGRPDVPVSYAVSAGRIKAEPSWNPVKLVAGAHGPTLIVLGLIIGLSLSVFVIVRIIRRRRALKIRR